MCKWGKNINTHLFVLHSKVKLILPRILYIVSILAKKIVNGEKMSNIVILSTFYLNIPSANGLCARNLVDAFRSKGHNVFVVCYDKKTLSDEPNREHVFTIPQLADKASGHLQKIKRMSRILQGNITPLLKEKLVDLYYNRICEISKIVKIDAIVAMFFPLEGIEAMYKFSSEMPKVKTIIYELDSIGDGVLDFVTKNFYNRVYVSWLREKYKCVTSVVVMKSHEKYWINQFGRDFANKMIVADLPIIVARSQGKRQASNEPLKMIYSGLIEKRYRSPTYLLSVLQELEKKIEFEISFYSKGDCESEIAETAKNVKAIKRLGYVTPEELDKATIEADFLVSIGNSVSRSVPSKLMSYISYGKPIIHFSSQKNDVCCEYLDKYPLALVVNQSDLVEKSCEKIVAFLENAKGKILDYNFIQKEFILNDPKYSAELILQMI